MSAKQTSQRASDRGQILIVDDRADKLLAITAVVEPLGRPIVSARSGKDALRELLARDFAVILLDINMPDMDGFETAALIRGRSRSESTPIIFMTAEGDEIRLAKSYSLGAVDYILTPVIPDVLRTKVGVFVELYEKRAQVEAQAKTLERRAEQLQRLAAASIAINAAPSIDAMLTAVSDAARTVLGAHQAIAVAALPMPGQPFKSAVSLGDKHAAWRGWQPVSLTDGVLALAPRSGPPLRLREQDVLQRLADTTTNGKSGSGNGPPPRGLVAAPLASRTGRQLGVLAASDPAEGDFTESDEAILVQLAQCVSVALDNWVWAEEREASRLKDEFLATLSHELRTPLQAMLGWTRVLLGSPTDTSRVVKAGEVIERNLLGQARMMEDLLDLSRITRGKMTLAPQPAGLYDIVAAAVETQRAAADGKGVELVLRGARNGDDIHGDPDRLRQVVLNLLSNAIKFTPRGGRVEASIARRGHDIALDVRDTGEGIEPSFLPLVFDRFRQADGSTRRQHGGLGIGLAVVRHIIELHGGSVTAHSDGKGCGATLTVRLPAVQAPATTTPSQPPPAPESCPSLDGITLLLVEDDDDTREVVKEILEEAGALVVTAESARSALEVLSRAVPDAILSDLGLPDQDGFELMIAVRRSNLDAVRLTPAIALSAYTAEHDAQRARDAGYQRHMGKPVEPEALVTAIRDVIRSAGKRDDTPRPAASQPDKLLH